MYLWRQCFLHALVYKNTKVYLPFFDYVFSVTRIFSWPAFLLVTNKASVIFFVVFMVQKITCAKYLKFHCELFVSVDMPIIIHIFTSVKFGSVVSSYSFPYLQHKGTSPLWRRRQYVPPNMWDATCLTAYY